MDISIFREAAFSGILSKFLEPKDCNQLIFCAVGWNKVWRKKSELFQSFTISEFLQHC